MIKGPPPPILPERGGLFFDSRGAGYALAKTATDTATQADGTAARAVAGVAPTLHRPSFPFFPASAMRAALGGLHSAVEGAALPLAFPRAVKAGTVLDGGGNVCVAIGRRHADHHQIPPDMEALYSTLNGLPSIQFSRSGISHSSAWRGAKEGAARR